MRRVRLQGSEGIVVTWELSDDEYDEIYALLDGPDDTVFEAYTSAVGDDGRRRKRKPCTRTPAHPHCRSVKWSRVYEALRRKGKSKKNSAQIANHMYNKWRAGLVKRKAFP